MTHIKQLLAFAGFWLLTLGTPAPANAYTYANSCSGCASRITGAQKKVRRHTNIPAGSAHEADLLNAPSEWNSGVMAVSPAIVSGTSSSSVIIHGDGIWEAALVPPGALGTANGLAVTIYSGCVVGRCSSTMESDIMVTSDLAFGNPDESAWDFFSTSVHSARDVFVHEWGHLLGLNHEQTFNVMKPGGLKARVGGTGTHSSPGGDDRWGAASLYGNPSSFKNLSASAQWFQSGDVTTTSFIGTINVTSASMLIAVNPTLVNSGTQNLTFNYRIYLNTCPWCYGAGITWGTGIGAIVNNRNQVFVGSSLNPPLYAMVCNRVYWVFHDVDSSNAHAEAREFDNSVHHTVTLYKPC